MPTAPAVPAPSRVGLFVAVLAFSGIVVSLMQTLVIPLIPEFPTLLGAPASDTTWAIPATLLAGAVVLFALFLLAEIRQERPMLDLALFRRPAFAGANIVAFTMAASAFSMRVSTSPMPRMRLAMRSGWNASNSSSFSPVPAKRIGFPTTSFTDSAAPPRASPSILVRITPSRPTVS